MSGLVDRTLVCCNIQGWI